MDQKYVDAHALLKQSTDEIHTKLHHVPVLEKFSKGDFSREDYSNYLGINHSFYKNLESHFADVNFITFEDEMNFVPWIEQDLAALQDSFCQRAFWFSDLPKSFSAYIGFEYVKYGSMTGSLVLLSRIAKTNRIDINSLNFLTQSASNRNRIWPKFLEFMQIHQDSVDINVAIESAHFCFNLMYQYASVVQIKEANQCCV